jgi:hypothetical protein
LKIEIRRIFRLHFFEHKDTKTQSRCREANITQQITPQANIAKQLSPQANIA